MKYCRFTESKTNYIFVLDHHSHYSRSPDWARGDHLENCVYAFGIVLAHPEAFNTTGEEKELSRDMLRYQFNFAKTG